MGGSRMRVSRPRLQVVAGMLLLGLAIASADEAAAADNPALANKFMLRLSSYAVRNADTDLTVLSEDNLGSGFSFVDDLGGEDDVTVPRLDAVYRVTQHHSVEFAAWRIERDGRNLLTIDLDIGDQSYSVGDTVISEINYELFKLGYAFTFYHSDEAELAFTLGINHTDYEFEYELVDGTSADKSDASGPLPMFGIRMVYAMTPKWSLHYLTEVLFVDSGDVEGSMQNYEIDFRYRWGRNIFVGAGLARFSIDVTSEDDDWDGKIADTHQGYLLSAGYYF